MKNVFRIERVFFLIFIASVIGVFLRFYNLNWGNQFYFHPDERNIASSTIQLSFPSQLNPHFFAYGSFPIYTIYFTGLIINFFSSCQLSIVNCQLSFPQAIIVSRFYSALLSILLIPSIYILAIKLKDKTTGIIAVFLTIFSTGLIQFAHFGTFEMWTAFLSLWLFYFSIKLTTKLHWKDILITGILLGFLLAVKISNLILLPIPFVALFLAFFSAHTSEEPIQSPWRRPNGSSCKELLRGVSPGTAIFLLAFATFSLTSPFVFLDFSSFLSSVTYESSVALGKLPVFYTVSFYDTIPVIFQFTKIYPFLINPFLIILFIPSVIYITYIAFKRKLPSYYLLFTIYYLLFFSQAFLFAKWTRYIVPTLPFIYLIVSISITDFLRFIEKRFTLMPTKYFISGLIIFISIVFSISYFITVHTKTDSRVLAASWAKKNITGNAKILSEAYDPGIMAFNSHFPNITLFNFYDLDQSNTSDGTDEGVRLLDKRGGRLNPEQSRRRSQDSSEVKRLETVLSQNNYIILPSQRIMKNRLLNKKQFPNGFDFYEKLFSEDLGFDKVYQTPCDIFCKITYLGNPIFSTEETASVFDRPIVFIFKKFKI